MSADWSYIVFSMWVATSPMFAGRDTHYPGVGIPIHVCVSRPVFSDWVPFIFSGIAMRLPGRLLNQLITRSELTENSYNLTNGKMIVINVRV